MSNFYLSTDQNAALIYADYTEILGISLTQILEILEPLSLEWIQQLFYRAFMSIKILNEILV